MTQSSCKRDTKSKSHPGVKLTPERFFSCKHPSDAYLLLVPDYMIGDFQSGTKFIFCSHDTRMKHTRARISFRLKTGMNSFWLEWLEWELNVTSVSREQVQRNIWRWYELVPEWKSFHQLVNSPLLIVWLSWLHSHLSFRVTQDVLIV